MTKSLHWLPLDPEGNDIRPATYREWAEAEKQGFLTLATNTDEDGRRVVTEFTGTDNGTGSELNEPNALPRLWTTTYYAPGIRQSAIHRHSATRLQALATHALMRRMFLEER